MPRQLTLVTLALTAVVAFLVGAIVAGGVARSAVSAGPAAMAADPQKVAPPKTAPAVPFAPNFADVVARINAAVVNIDATMKSRDFRSRRPSAEPGSPEPGVPYGYRGPRRDFEAPRRGAGSGFIIDADGSILTNNHVVDGAERITVKLTDGRLLRARVVGADPDTDIALIKVDGQHRLPVAPLGDSSALRTGEWVCAIGNPLGYEHSVTVGVVSFLGRKLFDQSLDDYIQTDAAINFGNSGGPLINVRGEVVGINAAISSRASNIGFAVPINGATAILAQLRTHGHVTRGYMGVTLHEVDADLNESLKLGVSRGALVQDITPGSPGERAGLMPYDVIVAIDDRPITADDQLIREIASRAPGSAAHLKIVRDGNPRSVAVRFGERPARPGGATGAPVQTTPLGKADPDVLIGLNVRDLDRQTMDRLDVPRQLRGVLITRVEPMSSAFDSGLDRGSVLLEINRRHVESVADYRRITSGVHAGDVLALYVYAPEVGQRQLKTIRVEDR
jgi:serine protease Do